MNIQEFIQNPDPQIILYPEPILLTKTQEIKDFTDWHLVAIKMLGLLNKFKAYGLAACQVSLPYSMFVINITKPICVINPKILEIGKRTKTELESCLSIPGISKKITRPDKIKVSYSNEFGNTKTEQFQGWNSRCFQHEYDHCYGITILDKQT